MRRGSNGLNRTFATFGRAGVGPAARRLGCMAKYRPALNRRGSRRRKSTVKSWGSHMRIVHLACAFTLLGAFACRPDGAAAQGSDAAREACTPDAMRLCGDVIPDVAKVTACMRAKSRQLSEPCRVAMRGGSSGGHRTYHHHYTHHCHHCS